MNICIRLSKTFNKIDTLLQVGDRCEVDPGGKRGEVKFVGKAESLAAGYWVGVQYDEPVGKNDGMYDSDILRLQLYL